MKQRAAFSTAEIKRLMARTPTYMTLDDHELWNDWTQDALALEPTGTADTENERQLNLRRYRCGLAAYDAYQWLPGPAFDGTWPPDASLVKPRYYRFERGPARFFILDVRAERYKKPGPPQMIGPTQFAALKEWLAAQPDGLKFVGSGVPVFPDVAPGGVEDRWSGYQEQRLELLEFIRVNGIRRVVFLSGDVHESVHATLTHDASPDFRVHSIVSSAFYVPGPSFPIFFWKGGLLDGASQMGKGFRVKSLGGNVVDFNFTRVTVEGDSLKVEVVGVDTTLGHVTGIDRTRLTW